MKVEIKELSDKLKDFKAINELKKNLSLSTESEKRKSQEIAKRLRVYFKNKDFEGAKKYLTHVKANL
jgi:hypothetical protein